MTEKRFDEGECGDFGYWIEDTVTGEKIRNEKVVDLLNEQQEELERLREHNKRLKETLIKQNEIIHHANFDEIQQIRELKLE